MRFSISGRVGLIVPFTMLASGLLSGCERSHFLGFNDVDGGHRATGDLAPDNPDLGSEAATIAGNGNSDDVDAGADALGCLPNGCFRQVAKLTFDQQSGDQLGASAALAGNLIIVGTPGAGAAWVFERRGDRFVRAQKVEHRGDNPGGGFGSDVAVSRDTVLIARGQWDDPAVLVYDIRSGRLVEAGSLEWPFATVHGLARGQIGISGDTAVVAADTAVQFFQRSGATWQRQTVAGPRTSLVAISGDRAVAVDNHCCDGQVQVYERAGNDWQQHRSFTLPAKWASSVALSGDLLVVGASGDSATHEPGAAYVYQRSSDDQWQLTATLGESPPRPDGAFGAAVAIDGQRILVSMTAQPDLPAPLVTWHGGGAHLYVPNASGGWQEAAKLEVPATSSDAQAGSVVALGGDVAVVGAPADSDILEQSGAAHVFLQSGPSWQYAVPALRSGDLYPRRGLGEAMALSGDRVAIANLATTDIQIAERDPDGWHWKATLPIPDCVPLNLDASTLALAGDDLAIACVDGKAPGVVYVFHRGTDGSWGSGAKLDAKIPNERFGSALAFDGDTLVVSSDRSAPLQLYRRSPSGWQASMTLELSEYETNPLWDYPTPGHAILAASKGRIVAAGGPVQVADVFDRVGDGWQRVAQLTPTTKDVGGFWPGVALDGDRIVIGWNVQGQGWENGRTFVRDAAGWHEGPRLPVPIEYSEVTVFGDEVAVGTERTDGFKGKAAIYRATADGYVEEQRIIPVGLAPASCFGAVALFSGGNLLISAIYEPIGQLPRAGAVYAFRR
jgi:hypothetical protein